MLRLYRAIVLSTLPLVVAGCFSSEPEGLLPAPLRKTTVKIDLFHKPLPEIPLPNDLATRYDPSSPTGRRINASMIAPTAMEARIRKKVDELDGWGTFQPIVIPFTGPIDVNSVLAAHRDPAYDFSDDVVYLVNIDRNSKRFGKTYALDLGMGNYPVVLENLDNYQKNDPRQWNLSLFFDEENEDKNGNGVLDPGEDTDGDGELDQPNYLPGKEPARRDLAGRADALMTFYERQTSTLILRPLIPLDERTRYAVVVTNRLFDTSGEPVGSPYPFVNHASQTEDLRDLLEVLPMSVSEHQIAFTFSFTTQTVQDDIRVVRDGIYGHGPQAHLADEFPAEVSQLMKLLDDPKLKQPHLLYGEEMSNIYFQVAELGLGFEPDTQYGKLFERSHEYIDYHVIGSFKSPQLFERRDKDGNLLPLDVQSWPNDLRKGAVKARNEEIVFWLTVPRKEVSVRKDGKPAPLIIVGHGYTSGRAEILRIAGRLAKYGMATLIIEAVSHGLVLNRLEEAVVKDVFTRHGAEALSKAIFQDRAFDQNNDGIKDSGADFWTAYPFHTRDVLRQTLLDYMQLVRVLRGFDGQKSWKFDVGGVSKQKIAGDFDGDGNVDIGGPDGKFGIIGGSLGGILSMLLPGVEPKVTMAVPIAGGGGLTDIGMRSQQGGVPQAFVLRVSGPLFVGTTDDGGKTTVETIVPDLYDDKTYPVGSLAGLESRDSVVIENLRSGERGCGYVSEDGTFRTAVAANAGDELRLAVYRGEVLVGKECKLAEGAELRAALATFEQDVQYQGRTFAKGDPLAALTEGLGLRRSHPELRRMVAFSQMIIDRGDPINFARSLHLDPIEFATGEKTGGTSLVVSAQGDMAVPVSSAVAYARAAGIIDYQNADDRYGTSVNQVLLDTYTAEAVDRLKRYVDQRGVGVHIDVEGFSEGTDGLGASYPRLSQPLRIGFEKEVEAKGSAAIFPLSEITGQHGFDAPGEQLDARRRACAKQCSTSGGPDPCGCSTLQAFDIGNFMFNLIGRFLQTGEYRTDLCMSSNDCDFMLDPPPARTNLRQ